MSGRLSKIQDLLRPYYNLIFKYFPYILFILIIGYLIYYILSYFNELRRRYNCLSLNNLFNGKIKYCFDQQPEYCKDIDSDLYWGWCQDADYLGVYPGNINGPYGFTCNRWITQPNKCPPIQCQGSYPIGIKANVAKNQIQSYGWCADLDVNRALTGSVCGPSPEENTNCDNWIWDGDQCPKTCPIKNNQNSNLNQTNRTNQNSNPNQTNQNSNLNQSSNNIVVKPKCSILCGFHNGKNIPCPPPDCNNKPEQCQCK